jgi:hypothetical protein
VFSAWSGPKSYLQDNFGNPVSCELSSARESEKRWRYSSVVCNGMSTEAEESSLLRAVTEQWLVKTLQAGED